MATLAGFYLVLRSSNLVPTSTPNFDPHEQLTRWHVGIDEDLKLVMVLIEWSKNNQNYKRELWVPVKPARDLSICLVKVLHRYFKAVLAKPYHPCFCYTNESGEVKALIYGQLNEQIKQWVTKTGRQGNEYTTHCLHGGGSNHAIRSGLSPEFVQVMGDWASMCFLQYIDFALDLRLQIAETMANA